MPQLCLSPCGGQHEPSAVWMWPGVLLQDTPGSAGVQQRQPLLHHAAHKKYIYQSKAVAVSWRAVWELMALVVLKMVEGGGRGRTSV